jgi:UDP-glucuronate decarboxylase
MAIADGRVVSNFIVQALRGDPISIFGDGSQSRSFCFVDDLVDGIYKVLMLTKNPETPINLGNPSEFSIRELAEKVLEIVDSKSVISFNPLPLDDPKQRCPDISKARTILNWEPRVPISKGLISTTNYFREII